MRWGRYACRTPRAHTQTPVRRSQRRFDARSRAIAARPDDFEQKKNDRRAMKGRSLVAVWPIYSALKCAGRGRAIERCRCVPKKGVI